MDKHERKIKKIVEKVKKNSGKDVCNAIDNLKPIFLVVVYQLEFEETFQNWLEVVSVLYSKFPKVTLDKFLPDNLDKTMSELGVPELTEEQLNDIMQQTSCYCNDNNYSYNKMN